MDYNVTEHVMNTLVDIAAMSQEPLIILRNPRFESAAEKGDPNLMDIDPYIMTIGNMSVTFRNFNQIEMIEVYASVKASIVAAQNAKAADAKSP